MLVYTDLWVGFTAITALLILGLAQTVVSYRGDSLIPGLGGNRPVLAEQEGGTADSGGGGAGVKNASWRRWRSSWWWRLSRPAC